MGESRDDLSEARSGCWLYISAIVYELQKALVKSIVCSELLSGFDFLSDLTMFEAVERHFTFEQFPK